MRYGEILNELTSYRDKEEFQTFMKGSTEQSNDGTDKRDLLVSFLEYLETKGYKPMGSGAFGAVFTHPGINYVIKVFKNDPAYLKFMHFSQANPANPHLPKFRGKWMTVDKTHFCVRMEKLTPLRDKDIARSISYFASSYQTPEEYIAKLKATDPDKAKKNVDKLHKKLAVLRAKKADGKIDGTAYWDQDFKLHQELYKEEGVIRQGGINQMSLDLFTSQPGLMTTVQQIDGLGYSFDLHSGNMMLRGNTVVITDPIYSSKDM